MPADTERREAARRRGRARALAASFLLAAALLGGSLWASGDPRTARGAVRAQRAPAAARASVEVGASGTRARVPRDFLGLSFEATTFARVAALAREGTLAHLLSSIGAGTLRFGGGSANRYVAWGQPGAPRPSWATQTVTASDLRALAAIARETSWKVLLTLNLAHYNRLAAAQESAAAQRQLGRSLLGLSVANEPDRFSRFGLREPRWGFSQYAHQLSSYRAALAGLAPGAAVAAPDASTGEAPLAWVWKTVGQRPALLTDHYYPLSSCGHKPTITELLGRAVRLQETMMLSALVDIQRTAGRPLMLDETNDVSCSGQPGVSNTFASALWAADFIARAMRAGLRGLDFHDLLNRPGSYSPLVGEGGAVRANPEWYALLLTRSLQGARVLPTALKSGSELTAQAFRRPDGSVALLLVNLDGARTEPVRVSITIPGHAGEASILRLTAPSQTATSGVELGGEEVGASGGWRPKLPLPAVVARGGSLAVSMPPASAALVSIGRQAAGTP